MKLLNSAPKLLLAFLLICIPRFAAASTQLTVQTSVGPRPYYVYTPPDIPTGKPVPVVFVLHPMLTSAAWAERNMGWDQCADKNGFLVVYGQAAAKNGEWNNQVTIREAMKGADDVGYLKAVMDKVERDYSIDPRRVFMVGFSSGAIMTSKMGALIPQRLSAIATVEGLIGFGKFDFFVPKRPISMICYRGISDHIVPYSTFVYPATSTAYDWARADGCNLSPSVYQAAPKITATDYAHGSDGSEVILMTVQGGVHLYLPEMTDQIWQLFTAHSRGTSR